MPIRSGDTVSFTGSGPPPTETPHEDDPDGEPRPGDYGEVLQVDNEAARVKWRFGAITTCSIDNLAKHPVRSAPHRYRVLFEQFMEADVTYTVVTDGGQAKAVWMASAALAQAQPKYRAHSVEVEDLGTDFQLDPASDLLAWDEVS